MPSCAEASTLVSEKPAARALPLGQPPSDAPGTAEESAADASADAGANADAEADAGADTDAGADVPSETVGTKRRRLSVLADAAILAS